MSAVVQHFLEPLRERLGEEGFAQLTETPRAQRTRYISSTISMPEADLLLWLSEATTVPLKDEFDVLSENTEGIPLRLIHEYQLLPIQGPEEDDKHIHLVTVWPPESEVERWIYAVTGKRVVWSLGTPERIAERITQIYGVGSDSLEDSDLGDLAEELENEEEENENAAIIRFINEIVTRAVEERATDIHFEPQKENLQIRYRIDGQLDPVRLPENLVQYQNAIISRLKIMAKLNISEKRKPQDGRIAFGKGREPLDIRISTLPTMYGESISLRLLGQKSQPLTLGEIGLLPVDETLLARTAQRPHGIILVTGPTGSGKSTTLTAVIRKIQSPERRIITVEDPVEYEVPGINQTQVRPEIGLDFAAALRTVLRQDPDVIMVGEIRDRETADIAMRASMTGHLVLSTLHTNDAAGALTRLIDMGIESFLIASTVELIIAQRLVRRLNPKLAVPANLDPSYVASCLTALDLPVDEAMYADKLMEISGSQGGYRGRLGIFELLFNTESIHELIVKRQSARVIHEQAMREGMRSLQSCGWEHCKRGLTTLSEIMKYARGAEEEEGN